MKRRRNPLSRTDKAATRLGITAGQVRRKIRQGHFGRVFKRDGQWMLQEDQVRAFIEQRRKDRKAARSR